MECWNVFLSWRQDPTNPKHMLWALWSQKGFIYVFLCEFGFHCRKYISISPGVLFKSEDWIWAYYLDSNSICFWSSITDNFLHTPSSGFKLEFLSMCWLMVKNGILIIKIYIPVYFIFLTIYTSICIYVSYKILAIAFFNMSFIYKFNNIF